jgi:hypothetical protein
VLASLKRKGGQERREREKERERETVGQEK